MKDAPQQIMPQADDIAQDLQSGFGDAARGFGVAVVMGAAVQGVAGGGEDRLVIDHQPQAPSLIKGVDGVIAGGADTGSLRGPSAGVGSGRILAIIQAGGDVIAHGIQPRMEHHGGGDDQQGAFCGLVVTAGLRAAELDSLRLARGQVEAGRQVALLAFA